MKAKLIFLLLILTFALMAVMNAQPTIGRFSLIAPDTVCADIDPMVKFQRSVLFGGVGVSRNFSTWNYGDGTISNQRFSSPNYHSYSVAGSYMVKACFHVRANGIWETSCDSQLVVVQTNCSQGIVPDLKLKQDSACVGYPIQFGDSLTGDFSSYRFLWDFGDGSYSTQGWGVKHTYNQTGLYATSLCVIYGHPQDTFCIQQLVPVKACLPIQSIAIQGPDSVCVGTEKYCFQPNITGGSGHYAYNWAVLLNGMSFSWADSTEEEICIAFTSIGTHIVSLKVTDLVLGGTHIVRDTIYTFPINRCSFSVKIDGPSNYCLSSGIRPIFQSEVVGGSGQYVYSWKTTQGGFTGAFTYFAPAFAASGTVEIDVTVTDQQSLQMVHDTVTVNLMSGSCGIPYLQYLTISPAVLCVGDSFHYANHHGYAYYDGYYVDFGDGNVVQNKRGEHAYAAAGVYTVSFCLYNLADGDTVCLDRQLWVAPQCKLELAVLTTEDYGNGDGTAHIDILRGNGEIEFQWDSSGVFQRTYQLSGLTAGTYHLYARNGQGLTDTVTYVIPYSSSVYPGDCNHDQVADIQDLLPIGIHHGSWGLARPNANLTWTAQPAPSWGATQANGRDLRHIDTDGDGLITDDDTLAIQLNYNMTHTNLRGANTGPKLFYQMPAGPHNAGDTLRIPVHLATMDTPVVNLYGLTFGITYDTALVKAGSARFDFNSSWLGMKGTNMLTMYHADTTSGKIEVGFVRKDQMNVSGFGRICDIIVVVDDHIGKRTISFRMGFLKPYAIDRQADEVEIGYLNGETSLTTGVAPDAGLLSDISVGQTAEALHIYHHQTRTGMLQLFDIHGRVMLSTELSQQGKSEVATSALSGGVYVLKIQTSIGVWQRKVVLLIR